MDHAVSAPPGGSGAPMTAHGPEAAAAYNPAMTRLLIADDHPLFRLALTQALRDVMPDAEIIEAGSLREAREALANHPDIDLVLLDLHLPDSHGLMGLAALRA